MHDEQLAVLRRRAAQEDLDAAGTAAASHHVRMPAVGQLHEFLTACEQVGPGALRVGNVDDLDLADQKRLVGDARKTAGLAHEPCRGTDRRDDRGLLDHHGNQVVAAVDLEIQAESHRQREHADDVLDQPVGGGHVEGGSSVFEGCRGIRCQYAALS